MKRKDRKEDELRKIEAQAGIVKNATGSARFKIGKTVALAAVYGPRPVFPRFLQNPKRGILRCHYTMLPFSGMGERIRPGQNRRAKEISLVTENALSQVVDLSAFPNSVVDVVIEIPEADAGTRCAGISAASMALADAGIPMKELIGSVAVGRVGESLLVDLDYNEEASDEGAADIPVAMFERTKAISLLQLDGLLTKEQLDKVLELAEKACLEVVAIQRKALKEQYQ